MIEKKEVHSELDFNADGETGEKSAPISIEDFFKKHGEVVDEKVETPVSDAKEEVDNELTSEELDAFKAIQESMKSDEEDRMERARAANRRAYAKRKKNMENNKPESAVKKETETKTKRKPKTRKTASQKAPKRPRYIEDDIFAVTLVMKVHLSQRYKEGCNSSPCQILGHNAFNKECKKNAFERLQIEQDKFRDWGITPEWFIISRDDVTILDPHFISTLKTLKESTHAVGPMGVSSMRRSGKFFSPDNANDIKGAIVQGSLTGPQWQFVKAPGYDRGSAHQVAVITSGVVAVRGETFMDIDFTEMAESTIGGFEHFIADICMEVNKRNKVVGVFKTLIRQEDSISVHADTEEFKLDHLAFVRKWQHYLPIRF